MSVQNLMLQFDEAVAAAVARQNQVRLDVMSRFGDPAFFRDSLKLEMINRPGHPDFPELYDFYASFFTLPDETETFEGFEATLKLNTDPVSVERFRQNEETWLYLREPDKGQIIAGVDFSTYLLPESLQKAHGFSGTNHIIYIFVKPEYRSLGIATHLLKLAEDYARDFCGGGEVLFFCEQNAPELMTAEEYFSDNLNALIDQCERLKWWDRLGYKRLNFNYVQPPLNPGMEPCVNLTFNVRAAGVLAIPAVLVKAHLERFFLIAVFKGREAAGDKDFDRQISWLSRHDQVQLSGSKAYYESLRKKIWKDPENWRPQKYLF